MEQISLLRQGVARIINLLSEYQKIAPRAIQWTNEYKRKYEEIMHGSKYGSEADKQDCQHNVEELIDMGKAFDQFIETMGKLIPYFQRTSKKIPFIGDLSNEKSAVMNAIVHEWVLPSTTGHTTDALVAIAGWEESQYRVREGCKETQAEDIMELHEVLEEAVGTGGERDKGQVPVVYVDVPFSDQQFIGTDTMLIDCPGSNNTNVFDGALKENCQDADVLVVVVDGIRKLTQSEKLFLYEAKKKIALPELFFVINKWDQVEKEPNVNIEEKKQRFLTDIETFCVKRLKKALPENRIFFVSAKATLDARRKKVTNIYTDEFHLFETALQAVLDQGKARLAQTYLDSAQHTAANLVSALKQVLDIAMNYRLRQARFYDSIQEQSFDELSRQNIQTSCSSFGQQVDKKYMEEMLNLREKLKNQAQNQVPTKEFQQNLESYISVDIKKDISEWTERTATSVIGKARDSLIGIISKGLREEEKHKLSEVLPCAAVLFSAPSVGDIVTQTDSKSEVTVADWAIPIATIFATTVTLSLLAYFCEDDEVVDKSTTLKAEIKGGEAKNSDSFSWTKVLKALSQLGGNTNEQGNKQELMSSVLHKFEHQLREALQRERPRGVEIAQQNLTKELNKINDSLCRSRRELVQAWKKAEVSKTDKDIRQIEKLLEEGDMMLETLKTIRLC